MGNSPPTIGGVKVYDRDDHQSDEVWLELDVAWAGNQVCLPYWQLPVSLILWHVQGGSCAVAISQAGLLNARWDRNGMVLASCRRFHCACNPFLT